MARPQCILSEQGIDADVDSLAQTLNICSN